MAQDPPRQPVSNLEALFARSQALNPQFERLIGTLAQATGGEAILPGLKGRPRAQEKVQSRYGGDASKLLDVNRASLVFADMESIYRGLDTIKGRVEVVEVRDRFAKPSPGGYRDITLSLRVNGLICELQLHHTKLYAAGRQVHPLYERYRKLEAQAKREGRSFTPQEKAEAERLGREATRLFTEALPLEESRPPEKKQLAAVEAAELKLLSKFEIRQLQQAGIDVHKIKNNGQNASKFDLFKDRKGEVFVMRKSLRDGQIPPQATGYNLHELPEPQGKFRESKRRRDQRRQRDKQRYFAPPRSQGPASGPSFNGQPVFRRVLDAARAMQAQGTLPAGALGELTYRAVPGRELKIAISGNEVRVSEGLLRELVRQATPTSGHKAGQPDRQRVERALGLQLAHEVAHRTGLGAERSADLKGVEIARRAGLSLTPRDATLALSAFANPGQSSRLQRWLYRARHLLDQGRTPGQRQRTLAAQIQGQPGSDALERFRRADGTVRWGEAIQARVFFEGGQLAHFGLALFLKEMSAAIATGNRGRLEEFFEGLLSTDFYRHYGLFVLGARGGDMLYGKVLAQHVKSATAATVLRNTAALSAGMALPQLIDGELEARPFVISVTTLGLSSALVEKGLAKVPGVTRLRDVQRSASWTRVAGATRLLRASAFVYTAAELALVLTLAEPVDRAVNGFFDRRAARRALREAGERFVLAVEQATTWADLDEAIRAYGSASTTYRNSLYEPVMHEDARLGERMEELAREAQRAQEAYEAALGETASNPQLRIYAQGRYGSSDGYARTQAIKDEAELGRGVAQAFEDYSRRRQQLLEELYSGERRGRAFLEGVLPGDGDGVIRAHESPATHRLDTYSDEAETLAWAAATLRQRGLGELSGLVEERLWQVERTQELDAALFTDAGQPAQTTGLVGAVTGR